MRGSVLLMRGSQEVLRASQDAKFLARFSSRICAWHSSCTRSVAMRIKSLLVTLGILGSSSLALADHDRFSNRWDRRHRDNYGYQQRTTWQPLSSQLQLRRGEMVDVQCNDRFGQLRLQNQTGR